MATRLRISSKFEFYRQRNFFIDCTIQTPEASYSAHKIVLAKYSKYFMDLFDSEESCEMYRFSPPFNPLGMLPTVVDFFYTGKIVIDESNVVAILAISKFYDITVLNEISTEKFRHFCDNAKVKNALTFMRQCADYKISEEGFYLVDIIVSNFDQIDRRTLFDSVDAKILIEIIEKRKPSISEDEILALIDDFHSIYPIDDPEDRENAARTIDWSTDHAHKLLVNHRCRWVPSHVAKPLLKRAMMARRVTMNEFQRRSIESAPVVSRWYPLTWMAEIRQASGAQAIDIDAVQFNGTFAGLAPGISPIASGSIVVSSTPPLCRLYAPENALNTNEMDRFECLGKSFYEIGFGENAAFQVTSFKFKCQTDGFLEDQQRKFKGGPKDCTVVNLVCSNTDGMLPRHLLIVGKYQDKVVGTYEGPYVSDEFPLSFSGPVSSIRIEILPKPGSLQVPVLRIFGIEARGHYIPV